MHKLMCAAERRGLGPRYRMDYMAFVDAHRKSGADVTIGCLPCDGERAQDFGLMKIDTEGNVTVRLSTSPHRPPGVASKNRS